MITGRCHVSQAESGPGGVGRGVTTFIAENNKECGLPSILSSRSEVLEGKGLSQGPPGRSQPSVSPLTPGGAEPGAGSSPPWQTALGSCPGRILSPWEPGNRLFLHRRALSLCSSHLFLLPWPRACSLTPFSPAQSWVSVQAPPSDWEVKNCVLLWNSLTPTSHPGPLQVSATSSPFGSRKVA